MAVISSQENNSSVEAVYKWIQSKLGIRRDENIKASSMEDIIQNKYNPRYIAHLLPEKDAPGIASFHFSNMSEHLTLSSNGQLNVRDGEEDLFKVWGKSEFRNLSPQNVFQELEDKILKIDTPALGEEHSFNSYDEFISWLAYHQNKNVNSTYSN